MKYDISKTTAPAMPALGKGTMHQTPAHTGLERHARTPRSDAFPLSWRAHQRRRISVSRPQLEGNMRHDGQSGGRFEL